MATCSDASGQFIATCFDDAASADVEAAARAGGCALLSVELDRRPGEDTPRVTIRGVQSFDAMANTTRLRMEVRSDDPLTMPALAALLNGARGGRGELRVKAILPDGGTADLLLGRDFLLDAELAAQVERLPGVTVSLSPIGARLELVA
jgi:DNA polymerase-3 subunit alpha